MKMKALIFLFLTILIFTGCRRQQHDGLTIEHEILTVGVEIGYPPMEYYDVDGLTPLGFNIDLSKALAEKLGLDVKFIDVAWDGILSGLDTYKYDMAVNITILPERQQRYNFTKPYIESSMTLVTLKDTMLNINSPQDIGGLRAGYQGDTTAQFFSQRLKNQGVEFSSFGYDKIINCFDDLRLGRLDIIIADSIVARYYTAMDNSIEIVWQGPADEYIGICLKKGNDKLTDALNNALDELFNDGTILEISNKYF